MAKRKDIVPLTISDIAFTVARQIEQCPKTMMIRELIANAIEASQKAPDGRRIVEIKSTEVTGLSAPKLCIWNTGPGLSSTELSHICDLASSIGKDMSLDRNFGMGAKVASLPSNTLGMRYRSCKDGVVSQVLLGKRHGTYGKFLIQVKDEVTQQVDHEEVIDVTRVVEEESEYSLKEDWTEVVLFGQSEDQNTVRDPYAGDPKQDKQWLTTYLYHRFYRIPGGVRIFFGEGTHPRDGRRPFEVLYERVKNTRGARVESVSAEDVIVIHYLYDPPYQDTSHNASISGSLTSSLSTCGLVFRDELFDVRKGRKWAADAPGFGIPFGPKHISVHIELPSTYPVIHEPYRRFLQYTAGDQRQVAVEEFASIVFQNRPQWLVDIIESLAPKSSSSTDDLRQELQALLNELRVKASSPRLNQAGELSVDAGEGRGARPSPGNSTSSGGTSSSIQPVNLTAAPAGAQRAQMSKNLEQAPFIHLLRTEDEVQEKDVEGKAARYYRESNQLMVNMLYSAVEEVTEHLRARYAHHEDVELVRKLAVDWAERIVLGRIGFAVVYAQAKQLARQWSPDDVRKALEPECLSLAADGWRDAVSSAYHSISRRIGSSQSKRNEAEAEADVEVEAV